MNKLTEFLDNSNFLAALIACCIPCLTFGQIAEIIDSGNTCMSSPVHGPMLSNLASDSSEQLEDDSLPFLFISKSNSFSMSETRLLKLIKGYGAAACATSGLIYGAILFLIGCPCILSCTYRTKLRSRFNLVESAGPDWISHFLCECCALTQEYRELKNRGLDPSIGRRYINTSRVVVEQATRRDPMLMVFSLHCPN